MNTLYFAKRNIKEMLRDPLSYVFALALPVVLFALLNGVFYNPQNAFWFSVDMMFAGVLTFSYSFAMLFLTILVSKDKSSAFLSRLFISPMKTKDFVLGYLAVGLSITLGQSVILYFTAWIISAIRGESFIIGGNILAILSQIPTMLTFVSLGVLFGTLFSEKAGPGITSAIISSCGLFCGAWMPVESFALSAKGFYILCRILPFYPSTMAGRLASGLSKNALESLEKIGFSFGEYDFLISFFTSLAYCIIFLSLAIIFFGKMKRKDKK